MFFRRPTVFYVGPEFTLADNLTAVRVVTRIPIRNREDERLLGWIVTDEQGGTFEKEVQEARHLYRNVDYPNGGWAFQTTIFSSLGEERFNRMRVLDTQRSMTYTIDRADFEKNAIPIDHGHGEQRVCALKHWKVIPLVKQEEATSA